MFSNQGQVTPLRAVSVELGARGNAWRHMDRQRIGDYVEMPFKMSGQKGRHEKAILDEDSEVEDAFFPTGDISARVKVEGKKSGEGRLGWHRRESFTEGVRYPAQEGMGGSWTREKSPLHCDKGPKEMGGGDVQTATFGVW